jgi:HEPN domain-containing protein
MSDLKHARGMFGLAQGDLAAVREMADNPAYLDRIVGFHAQQAVEKALKAWLSLIHVEYPRNHNLNVLFELLKVKGQTIPPEFLALANLTNFAVFERYDFDATSDFPLDRPATIAQVQNLLTFIAALIPPI